MGRDEVQAQLEALRRAQILDAAARIFASRGFHAARVQDIAREAGIANGTVYNYFPTKDALLLGLLDRLNETEARPAQIALLQTGSARDALAAVIKHRLAVLGESEDLLRALLPEILVNPELRARYLHEVIEPSFALGTAPMEARLGKERAEQLSRALAASVFGLVMFRLLEDPVAVAHADAIAELLADRFAPAVEGEDR